MPICGWIRTIWKSRCKLSPMRAFPSASMRKRLPQSSSGWHETPNQRPLMPSLRHATGTLADWRKVDEPGNRVMRIHPGFSVERRRQVLPYRNPEDFEHRVEGLRKAGLAV